MNFFALQLFDEESKQPMRVALNPRYIVTALAYTVEDKYVLVDGDRRTPVAAVSVTIELHHENLIDLLLAEKDAQMLIDFLHRPGEPATDVILFNDIRNQCEDILDDTFSADDPLVKD